MQTWITSDIHFNHLSILKYSKVRRNNSDNPEPSLIDLEEMNTRIINNWNNSVKPTDRVYILGDVAMGKISLAPNCIRQLNGEKHLVLGNHDKTLVKLPEFTSLFKTSQDYLELTYRNNGLKQPIVMSHFPFHSWNGQRYGTMMLHGHLHSYPDNLHIYPNRRIMDIGMDGNNLKPWLLDSVIAKLSNVALSENHHKENV